MQILHAGELDRFHREFYLKNRPVIIRGLREQEPRRIFDWSAALLTERMGDKVVPVISTQTGFLSYEREFVSMRFAEFALRLLGPPAADGLRYYFKNPTTLLPEGLDDSESIGPLRRYIRAAVARNLWISGSGLTVGMHFDPADNLNFALRGRKSFLLFPPGVRAYYPLPMFSQTAHISRVFRDGPVADLARFPRFDPSKGEQVELQAGELIYIPAYWWHQVESLGPENVNLNCWWLPKLRKQIRHPNQALRGHAQVLLRLLRHGNLQQTPAPKH